MPRSIYSSQSTEVLTKQEHQDVLTYIYVRNDLNNYCLCTEGCVFILRMGRIWNFIRIEYPRNFEYESNIESEQCREVLPACGVIGPQVHAGVVGIVAIRIGLFVYFLT